MKKFISIRIPDGRYLIVQAGSLSEHHNQLLGLPALEVEPQPCQVGWLSEDPAHMLISNVGPRGPHAVKCNCV